MVKIVLKGNFIQCLILKYPMIENSLQIGYITINNYKQTLNKCFVKNNIFILYIYNINII